MSLVLPSTKAAVGWLDESTMSMRLCQEFTMPAIDDILTHGPYTKEERTWQQRTITMSEHSDNLTAW